MKLSQDEIQRVKNNFFSKLKLNSDSIVNNKTFELVQNNDETLSIIKDSYIPISNSELQNLVLAVSSLSELKGLQNPIIKNTITSQGLDNKLEINFSKQASNNIMHINRQQQAFIQIFQTSTPGSRDPHPIFLAMDGIINSIIGAEELPKKEEMKIEFINQWATSQKDPNDEYPRLNDDIPVTQRTVQDLANLGYAWFKGTMDRKTAENFLKDAGEGAAIIRIGSNNTLVLSKKVGNSFIHSELLVAKALDEAIGYISNLRNHTSHSLI